MPYLRKRIFRRSFRRPFYASKRRRFSRRRFGRRRWRNGLRMRYRRFKRLQARALIGTELKRFSFAQNATAFSGIPALPDAVAVPVCQIAQGTNIFQRVGNVINGRNLMVTAVIGNQHNYPGVGGGASNRMGSALVYCGLIRDMRSSVDGTTAVPVLDITDVFALGTGTSSAMPTRVLESIRDYKILAMKSALINNGARSDAVFRFNVNLMNTKLSYIGAGVNDRNWGQLYIFFIYQWDSILGGNPPIYYYRGRLSFRDP